MRGLRPLVLVSLLLSCAGRPVRVRAAAAPVAPDAAAVALAASLAAADDGAVIPVSTNDPVWGSRTAPVTLVLFGDLECPYTGKVLPTVRALEGKYGPDTLRVVWKDLPLSFHRNARSAAEAAESAFTLGKTDGFWKFWEQALSHQTELSPASFASWASAAGIDGPSFARALDAHASKPKVDGDVGLAEKLGVEGTPTFFVNGRLVVGAQPVDTFVTTIDDELAKAKERLAAGVAPGALYADRTKTNWKTPEPDEPAEDTKTVWLVPTGNAPVRGNPDAPVTIVEFSDFQCPYCKKAEPTLRTIQQTYGDKVRIVWKDDPLPFHKRAVPAASLAREARAEKGDAGFWAVHDALFESQPNLTDEDLASIGAAAGLDARRVKTAIAGATYAAQLASDSDEADDVHAEGTPHFFINGRRLVGAQPYAAFQAIIDQEIKHASDLVAAGTAPRALYDTMMKSASPSPLPDVHPVAARAAAPFRGPAGAPVVIEEFADFQCPYCARADATLAAIDKRYPGKVKLVWRNLPLPFHEHAREAAEAALEAKKQKGNAGFWAMHDKLFAHAGDNHGDGSGLARTALDTYARDCGLDVAVFDKALDGHAHKAEIDEDGRAAEGGGIEGTPAFVVGNYLVSGAQPLGAFRRVIDQVLASGPGKLAALAPK